MSAENVLAGLDRIVEVLRDQDCSDAWADDLGEIRTRFAALVEAAREVESHVEGSLPVKGWLRDNDASRAALAKMSTARKAIGHG